MQQSSGQRPAAALRWRTCQEQAGSMAVAVVEGNARARSALAMCCSYCLARQCCRCCWDLCQLSVRVLARPLACQTFRASVGGLQCRALVCCCCWQQAALAGRQLMHGSPLHQSASRQGSLHSSMPIRTCRPAAYPLQMIVLSPCPLCAVARARQF